MKPTEFIWQNGVLKKWQEATVQVMAHGLHYGSTVFEGIRSYATDAGPAIFRLNDHIRRLFDSCKMYRMNIPYTPAELEAACCQVVRSNGLSDSYVRPIVYCDVGGLGLVPLDDARVSVAIGAIEWGPLLGKESIEKGTDICVSSWNRPQSSTNPIMAKAGGHYLTSQLIAREAQQNGYAEGIAVNQFGIVTEGAGSNIFMVKKGKLLTPPLGCSILAGITRETVIRIAESEGFEVVEGNMPRESLYCADEVFLCGTAAEVTPVVSIDRLTIGSGTPGEVTRLVQQRYFEAVTGKTADTFGWLTYVDPSFDPNASSNEQRVSAGTVAWRVNCEPDHANQ